MQTKYANDKTALENQLAQQRYEFAVREKANTLKFSSASAKKTFIQDAIAKGFRQDGETLLGYEDFVTKYKADDPGAFMQDTPAAPDNVPKVTLPGHDKPTVKKFSLSDLMRQKNENPELDVKFDN